MLGFLWLIWGLWTVAFCEGCAYDELCDMCCYNPGFDLTEYVKILVRHEEEPEPSIKLMSWMNLITKTTVRLSMEAQTAREAKRHLRLTNGHQGRQHPYQNTTKDRMGS
jgi:hypothetical protein